MIREVVVLEEAAEDLEAGRVFYGKQRELWQMGSFNQHPRHRGAATGCADYHGIDPPLPRVPRHSE